MSTEQNKATCEVCRMQWEDRQELERLLLAGVPIWQVSEQQRVAVETIQQHAEHAKHLSEQERLLYRIDQNLASAIAMANKAAYRAEPGLQLDALKEQRAILKLKAEVLGELRNAKVVSIAESTEWQELRDAVLKALDAYPEAKQAVVESLAHSRALPWKPTS